MVPARRKAAAQSRRKEIMEVLMDRVDPKVDEAIETLNMKDGPTRRRLLKGAGLVSATAAASALLAACSSSSSAANAAGEGPAREFPRVPAWQFWFVNHVTTNPFFVAHPVRLRRLRRAARHTGPEVDRLDELDRLADGRPDQRGGGGQGGRDRDHADRLHLVHHAGGERDERRHPGGQLQRRRQRQQAACPTSAPTGSATSARRCSPPASSSASGSSRSSRRRARS